MKYPTLYKRTKTGSVQEWTIELEGNKHRTIVGKKGGKLIVGAWTTETGVNVGKLNATSDEEQALRVVLRKITKQKEGNYVENIETIDKDFGFSPMLASGWDFSKNENNYPLYSQPKLDGIRCIVNIDGMWSRNGKPILSAPHIYESLSPIFDVYPNSVFDGELYNHEFKENFNKIISLTRKSKPTTEDLIESSELIQYHIYDYPSDNGNFVERSSNLVKLFHEFYKSKLPSKSLKLVKTVTLHNEKDVADNFDSYTKDGYEGQMVRTDGPYEQIRSKTLMKHKVFVDQEYIILDICEGRGKRKGTAGYFSFENEEGKKFNSNLKCTFEDAAEYLVNKNTYIGKTATVQFCNKTPDNIPRFPYVTKVARETYE